MHKVVFSIVAIILISVNSSCGQNGNRIIDEKIIVLKKEIRRYDREPGYFIMFNSYFCNIEVFVNDIAIYKNYGAEEPTMFYPININEYILKKGEQKVTVRLLPNEGNSLSKETVMKLEIAMIPNLKIYQKFDNEKKTLLKYKTPITQKKDETDVEYGADFQYAGLPIFEKTFTFHADVPYTVQGWEKSEILNGANEDLLKMEKEVVAFYEKMKEIYEKKHTEKFITLMEPRLKERVHSHYDNENDLKKIITGISERFTKENKIHKIENYKLVFYADGRLVTLEPKDSDKLRLDQVFRIETTIYDNRFKEEVENTLGFKMLLHKPKGSNAFEIIR